MQVNPKMVEAFHLYTATKRKHQVVPFTTLAHRIVYAKSEHKGVDLYYLDNANKLCSMVIAGETSLAILERTHGNGFVRINRNLIVNTEAITGVFPVSDKEFACSVVGVANVLPISRRSLKAVRLAFESVKHVL